MRKPFPAEFPPGRDCGCPRGCCVDDAGRPRLRISQSVLKRWLTIADREDGLALTAAAEPQGRTSSMSASVSPCGPVAARPRPSGVEPPRSAVDGVLAVCGQQSKRLELRGSVSAGPLSGKLRRGLLPPRGTAGRAKPAHRPAGGSQRGGEVHVDHEVRLPAAVAVNRPWSAEPERARVRRTASGCGSPSVCMSRCQRALSTSPLTRFTQSSSRVLVQKPLNVQFTKRREAFESMSKNLGIGSTGFPSGSVSLTGQPLSST
jgi:hypothetical protein